MVDKFQNLDATLQTRQEKNILVKVINHIILD